MKKLDFNKMVEEFRVDGITLAKVTDKFIKTNFSVEINDLITVMSQPSNLDNTGGEFVEGITNAKEIEVNQLFMGQEMKLSLWLGFVENMLPGEFIRTIKTQTGLKFLVYDKTDEKEHFVSNIEKLSEKRIVEGLKGALKDKIKAKK